MKVISDTGFGLEDFPVMPNQADSEAAALATLVTEFNALLGKLQDAGLMAKS